MCQLSSAELTAQTDVSISTTASKLPVSGSAPWTAMLENVKNMAGLFPVNHVLHLIVPLIAVFHALISASRYMMPQCPPKRQ